MAVSSATITALLDGVRLLAKTRLGRGSTTMRHGSHNESIAHSIVIEFLHALHTLYGGNASGVTPTSWYLSHNAGRVQG